MKLCPKCGKELLDEAVVCPECGCMAESAERKTEKQGKKVLLIILIIILAGLCVIGYLKVIVPNRYIKMVKNGAPDSFPGITWDEAVDKVMDNPAWSYQGDNTVEVTGNNEVAGTITIIFSVNTATNRFNVTSIEVAGEKYTDVLNLGLLVSWIFGY